MGAIIWSLQNCVNTILDIVTIKTGLVISEDYLVEILKEEFSFPYFDHYEEAKELGVRIRSEDFDMFCWKARKKMGELENISPLFVQDPDITIVVFSASIQKCTRIRVTLFIVFFEMF